MSEGRWVEAGLVDLHGPGVQDRLELLAFLESEGCTVAEMVAAQMQGRLFALAGDRVVRPGSARYDLAAAAAELGVAPERVERFWRALGLPSPVEPVLGEQDLDALRTAMAMGSLLGEDAVMGMARVIGASMARIAEAASAVLRVGSPAVNLGASGSELVTAKAWARVAAVVPAYGRLLDAVHRQHIDSARRYFEAVQDDGGLGPSLTCGVGFADLSGFTRLSQELDMAQLSMLLTAFEDIASVCVQDAGGRVVKFLGDAVMFVAPTAASAAGVACALVGHVQAAEAGLEVRAGVEHGPVLAQDGDYFGPTVNLAARLVAAAQPGQVLAGPALGVAPLPGVHAEPGEPLALRGVDGLVQPYLLTRT